MSGNNPIKLIAIIAVAFVVVIVGIVAVPRLIDRDNSIVDEPSATYVSTTRGSNSGSFSKDESDSTKSTYSYPAIQDVTEKNHTTFQNTTANTTTAKNTTVKNTTVKNTTAKNTTVVPKTTKKPAPQVSYLEISSKASKTVYYIGDSLSTSGLRVKVYYSDGSSKDVTSSAKITVPDMSRSGSQNVVVSYSENNKKVETSYKIDIRVPYISLSSDEYTLKVGQYFYLTANIEPSDCAFYWTSSDESVATVSSSGKVSAISDGVAVIYASFTYCGNTYSESCIVTVEKNAPQSSTLAVTFDGGTYENDEYNLCLYDLEGTISSNYEIETVEIIVVGPVYINGNYDEITQTHEFEEVGELNTKEITLQELAELYGDDYYFDIIAGEEYIVYIYAEDSSGAAEVDYIEAVFELDE